MRLKSYGVSKKDLAFSVLLLAAFSVLFYLFPYTGDDWAWGSRIGLERLATWFDDYNGRYLGNLLVMVLTRWKWGNVLLTAVSMVAVCLLPKMFVRSEKFLPYALGTLFFFLMSRPMRVQVVVWAAGFSNYVPPILLIFLYLVMVQKVFGDEQPEYGKMVFAISPVIGFAAGLFMENVTLYNLAAAAAILVIAYVRFRKVYAVHLAYAVGSIAGAVMMFTNSAYGTIAQGGDEYRSSVLSEGLIRTISNNLNVIVRCFFLEHMAAWMIFTVLCLICYGLYLRSGAGQKICHLAASMHILCGVMLLVKSLCPNWYFFAGSGSSETITVWLFAMIAVFYCVSALVLVLFCVDDRNTKLKVLFLLMSILVLVAPLLVVNPVGPRCLFPTYMMLAAACVALLVYMESCLHIPEKVQKALVAIALAVCVVVMGSLVQIYGAVHHYDNLRNEYVHKQVDAGYTTVVVSRLPYISHVWDSDPVGVGEARFKLFHGIDQDVQFKILEPEAFDEWMRSFDESYNKSDLG